VFSRFRKPEIRINISLAIDRDVYVVSITNAIFPSPPGFVFVGVQYFFFQMLQYLGPNYNCVETIQSATGDGTIVIVRSTLHYRVSSVRVGSVDRPPITNVRVDETQSSNSNSNINNNNNTTNNAKLRLRKVALASEAHRRAAQAKAPASTETSSSSSRRRGILQNL
jgi:hypothetical protein